MGKVRKERFLNANRISFFLLALLLTSLPSILFIDLMYRTAYSFEKIVFTVLFVILMCNVGWGSAHAISGFILRRLNLRRGNIESTIDGIDITDEGLELASCVIALPVYNEDPKRVFAGVRAMYESLERTGKSEYFDFFILSDSTNSERWVEEEEAWATLCRDLDAFGRINYRRRLINKDRKAGNIHEFCEDWGKRYRYMVTLDADSVMSGDDLVKLSLMMERNPQAGLIQTAPRVVYGESLWGRVQQFANRFYGPVFMDGLNFWQQGNGNYWGHNAIIRMAAFMEYCALPDLPGKEPFGGKILSHDFVEAALMRKAGYEVWLARELGGTYEEGPQDLVEHVVRDRRWCQGNLQHIWLLFSKGLLPGSRTHLANGIMSYAASLFWLAFLILGGILAYNQERSQLTIFPVQGFTNVLDITIREHGELVAAITFTMLFFSKGLAVLDSFLTKGRNRRFGGGLKAVMSVVIESVVSIFVAPLFMLYHSRFVVSTALGKGITWKTQNRGAGSGLKLYQAFLQHWDMVFWGGVAVVAAKQINPYFFWWLSPVWFGLLMAPVSSCLLSKPSIGGWLRRTQILATPEEIEPEQSIVECEKIANAPSGETKEEWEYPGFMKALLDPYVNAIRVHMAQEVDSENREKPHPGLSDRLLEMGAGALNDKERKSVLSDPTMLESLYRMLWTVDPDRLHPSWKSMIADYGAAVHR
ncbi:glucans biosynthesis glucosyltransferase MdoH [Puniceicoccaceae bacterium K14]|nr:glucans biosynthesis glucosyltransferase MdoH [Puniceicoccaceae bacterium K14]